MKMFPYMYYIERCILYASIKGNASM